MVTVVILISLNVFSMRALTNSLHTFRHVESTQALDLAQAGVEQFRHELSEFFANQVYLNNPLTPADPTAAMLWFDNLETAVNTGGTAETPIFNPYDHTPGAARMLPFASTAAAFPPERGQFMVQLAGTNPVQAADLNPNDGIAAPNTCAGQIACEVTIISTGTVGGVSRAIRATLRLGFTASEVFRYLYFVNNYGFFTGNPVRHDVRLHGDIRSNGDMQLAYLDAMNGDAYAAANPALPGSPTGTVTIGAGVRNWSIDLYDTPSHNGGDHRPIDPYLRDQPDAIPGNVDKPEQGNFVGYTGSLTGHEGEAPMQMPAIGDLDYYKELAMTYRNGEGSMLRYWDPGPDGVMNNSDDREITITGVYDGVDDYYRVNNGNYWSAPTQPLAGCVAGDGAAVGAGPDGACGTPDDGTLIVYGNYSTVHPGPVGWGKVEIDGPVVIPVDAIMAGGIWKGQGTVYSGRNVHITKTIWNSNADIPKYPIIQQSTSDANRFRVICNNGSNYSGGEGTLSEVQALGQACP
jgi:hypothetical protein